MPLDLLGLGCETHNAICQGDIVIGRIRGTLLEKRLGAVLIEAGGVGYDLEIPYTTYFRLGDVGSEATLLTHFAVREDAQTLYGFSERIDRDLFRALIRTSGVGPKLALAILSGLDPEAFISAVEMHDVATLVKIPGVGKKTAERLLIEMTDRIKKIESPPATLGNPRPETRPASAPLAADEAEEALIALGFKPQEASRAVARIAVDGMDSEALIRQALKGMLR